MCLNQERFTLNLWQEGGLSRLYESQSAILQENWAVFDEQPVNQLHEILPKQTRLQPNVIVVLMALRTTW